MSRVVATPEITEGWMQDQNKYYLFRKKDNAAWAIGDALASPTPTTIRIAFGRVSDYNSYLVHGALGRTKEELNRDPNYSRLQVIRSRLQDICNILYASPNDPQTQEIYKKYGVRRSITQSGIYKKESFSNIALLAIRMQEIFYDLNEYAQQAGFGSAKAISKIKGKDKLLEECGLDEDDICETDDE